MKASSTKVGADRMRNFITSLELLKRFRPLKVRREDVKKA
jgi:hypothetical protein